MKHETLPSFEMPLPSTLGGLPQEIDHLLRVQLFTFGTVKKWNLKNSNPDSEPVVHTARKCENRPTLAVFMIHLMNK